MAYRWFSHSRNLCVLLVMATSVSMCAVTRAVEPAKAPPKPEEVMLTTQDGVALHVVYLPGTQGKETVPIIMLHGWKGSGSDYGDLALYLQSRGHAVILPDLRGHGKSTKRHGANKDEELDAATLKPAEFGNMVQYDVESVKTFLLTKNNAGELNVEKLCVVGAEMGAVIALNWAAVDYSWPQLANLKQGRDVKALVLLSPEINFKGLTTKQALSQRDVLTGLSMLMIVGKQNSKAMADTKRVFDIVERAHPPVKPEDAADKKDVFLATVDTSLEGTKILTVKNAGVDKYIAEFIDARLVKKTFPWTNRKNPLE